MGRDDWSGCDSPRPFLPLTHISTATTPSDHAHATTTAADIHLDCRAGEDMRAQPALKVENRFTLRFASIVDIKIVFSLFALLLCAFRIQRMNTACMARCRVDGRSE